MAKDLYNNALPVRCVAAQSIAGGNLVSGDIDLAGFEAVDVVLEFGDIAEMGASPEGAARIDLRFEHADDDGAGMPAAYADVGDDDVLGASGISGGVVATTSSDLAPLHRGYRGAKRFLRVSLVPTGLATGGPVCALAYLGHPRHAPVQ